MLDVEFSHRSRRASGREPIIADDARKEVAGGLDQNKHPITSETLYQRITSIVAS
jgi:hypothetical protein